VAYDEFIVSYGRRINHKTDQKVTASIRVGPKSRLMDNLGLARIKMHLNPVQLKHEIDIKNILYSISTEAN
jgi:hypothetical protein